jgi:isopenicillin N synthase-like dioxygenase
MSIPIVSLEPVIRASAGADEIVAEELRTALGSWGAFELVDHGVPMATIDGAFAAASAFFRLPVEERMKVRIDRHNRGYAPLHQTVYPGNLPDLKESFNVGTRLSAEDPDVMAGKPLHGVNQWPASVDFRTAVETYFDALMTLGDRLLGPLAICLGLTPSALRARYRKPVAFMRLFHYPPNSNVAQNEFGAAEHKDYGFLTIWPRTPPADWKYARPQANSSSLRPVPAISSSMPATCSPKSPQARSAPRLIA